MTYLSGNGAFSQRKERCFFKITINSKGLLLFHAHSLIHSRVCSALAQDFKAATTTTTKFNTLCSGSLKMCDKCRTMEKKYIYNNNVNLPLLCKCPMFPGGGLSTHPGAQAFLPAPNPSPLLLPTEISIASPSRGFLRKLLALQSAFLQRPVLHRTMAPIQTSCPLDTRYRGNGN